MQRNIMSELAQWQQSVEHIPLLLRGARQVGKSYIVEQFAKSHFESNVIINFEKQPILAQCFEDLDPSIILEKIFLATGNHVSPGNSLLFLDEIQECPKAILALRYFKEECPELHVIGAGSLLEFTLNEEEFRMPVGRVKSLYVKPFSFYEYLNAAGYSHLVDYCQSIKLTDNFDELVHQQLEEHLRKYFFIGGMPAVIRAYLREDDLSQIQAMQTDIMSFYRRDFGKYASKANHPYMQRVLERAPGLIGQRCKYSKLDAEYGSRELKRAVGLLSEAAIISKVHSTNASGLPLNVGMNENIFKLLLLDVGLANAMSFLSPQLLLSGDLMQINRGALAEQFVGQELLANTPHYLPGELFYWERDKPGSGAEVDYVIHIDETIIPVEVKSGKTGSLRSLQLFLNEKGLDLGLRLSLKPLGRRDRVLSIPLYMIAEIRRLVMEVN